MNTLRRSCCLYSVQNQTLRSLVMHF